MITIQNLYYLLLYAWDIFEEDRIVAVDADPATELVDLLASVFTRGIDVLLRRGPDRGYLSRSEQLSGIRGRLDMGVMVKAVTQTSAKAVCQFDELSYDVVHNQILRATLSRLLRAPKLDSEVAARARLSYARFPMVRNIRLNDHAFRKVQLHRSTRFYRFLLGVARLLYRQLIPVEAAGEYRCRSFRNDEKGMRRVFERFLFNFFRREQSAFHVKRDRFPWKGSAAEKQPLLPTMTTDVTLRGSMRWIVIDAKYTRHVFQSHPHGSGTFRSAHLYQLFAYLSNLRRPEGIILEGLLLYPRSSQHVDEIVNVHGMSVRVYTIDLNQNWRQIRMDLLKVIGVGRESLSGG